MLELVAHRGYPERLPENSLAGMRAALETGARYVEFDVQFSRDGVPVVLHDASLLRSTGTHGNVFDLDYADIITRPAGEPSRFGDRHRDYRVPHCATMLELVDEFPAVTAFVEVKRASLERIGRDRALDALRPLLEPRRERAVLVSFDREILAMGRDTLRIGWAFEPWKVHRRRQAMRLEPEFLFTSLRGLPPGAEAFWQGPWRWVVYEVPDLAEAQMLHVLGAHLVESDDIGGWLAEKPMTDDR